jgi:hexosaminidase
MFTKFTRSARPDLAISRILRPLRRLWSVRLSELCAISVHLVLRIFQKWGETRTVELYSAVNGWFFQEEDKLGSIEPGKLGDLAVLSADFLIHTSGLTPIGLESFWRGPTILYYPARFFSKRLNRLAELRTMNTDWMKARICVALACCFVGSGAWGQLSSALNLMPMPANVRLGAGRLAIGPNFSVVIEGPKNELLDRATRRFLSDLSRETGLPFPKGRAADSQATVVIRAKHVSHSVQQLEDDESYTLDLTDSGATLSAATQLGILHGLQTFLQLVEITPQGFSAPAVHIEDRPRFLWRGLSIDVSRHFIPVEALKRTIDGMERVKLNVLHWHLSDDQGFRAESKKFPKLQKMGSDGFFYTQSEIREVINYARDRGIRVVPEFDMPGHATAWFPGYPELASAPGPYQIERRWGIFDPVMDPTRDETYRFLDKFMAEMATLFPDRYFHIGGDEANGKQWDANPKIQAFMRGHNIKNNAGLQQYFTERVQKIVAKHHKLMVGWDEILAPGMAKGIVIQSWRGQDSLAAAAKQGYSGLLSHGYYLDAMWTAAQHYAVDPLSGAVAPLTEDEQKRILGGEACVWSEFVTADNIDSRIWPRVATIAERLWSPGAVKDVNSMYERLAAVSAGMVALGISPESQMETMLMRLANTDEIGPLRILADVVAPASLVGREEEAIKAGGVQTSETPLNRMTDIVAPESEAARRFSVEVNALIAADFKDAALESQIRSQLAIWRENDVHVERLAARSYLLAEITTPSQQLSALAAAGLEALDHIDKVDPVSVAWRDQRLGLAVQAQKPEADLLLMLAQPIQMLIQAVPAR